MRNIRLRKKDSINEYLRGVNTMPKTHINATSVSISENKSEIRANFSDTNSQHKAKKIECHADKVIQNDKTTSNLSFQETSKTSQVAVGSTTTKSDRNLAVSRNRKEAMESIGKLNSNNSGSSETISEVRADISHKKGKTFQPEQKCEENSATAEQDDC